GRIGAKRRNGPTHRPSFGHSAREGRLLLIHIKAESPYPLLTTTGGKANPYGHARQAELTILVDTNLAPSGDRTGYWRQAVERLFGAIVRVDTSTPLDARLAIHRLERVQLIELSGNPMTFTWA